MEKITLLTGRVLLAHLFLLAGISKIGAYAGTQGYMESMGAPGALLPLVILTEVGGALALIVGWQTRWAAIALAGFSILSALMFHTNFSDQIQMIMFMKNGAIAGGLLVLAAAGPGGLSLDHRRGR
ncbi:MAG: putative oxidoreductase [Gammaproteobacteria bacterium]|nr:MAG: putative oxidoreductase [Gammaproteobacteria bacterium]TND04398.1 MAG: putative oxidoreductase [Gammaproteobacteria bacterium]